jgi:hypothetical protein
MKREFDLNNLTDEEVELIEKSLEMRRILKMGNPAGHILITQAISSGFRPHELCAIVAPNYENTDRSIFAQSRQIGKSLMTHELLKPYLEFEYTPEIDNQIDESHEQYNAIFNQFRRTKYLPSIELKIGNKYEIKLVENIKELYLTRIDGNIKWTPELYFSVHSQPKTGTNISVYKILKEIKE